MKVVMDVKDNYWQARATQYNDDGASNKQENAIISLEEDDSRDVDSESQLSKNIEQERQDLQKEMDEIEKTFYNEQQKDRPS